METYQIFLIGFMLAGIWIHLYEKFKSIEYRLKHIAQEQKYQYQFIHDIWTLNVGDQYRKRGLGQDPYTENEINEILDGHTLINRGEEWDGLGSIEFWGNAEKWKNKPNEGK